MRKLSLLVGALILVAFVFTSCGDDETSPVTSTNRAPGQPTLDTLAGAPANGATGVSRTPTLGWACTDPDGNVLKYTVSFGTTSPPPVVSTDQSAKTYSPASLIYSTTYYWSITAKDPAGATATSAVWSFTTLAAPAETVTAPSAPSGPATGIENEDLAYTANGSVSNLGDGLEYRFDWGDGSFSTWATTAIQNSWATAGTYDVKAQGRCVAHPTVESDWSIATTVTVTVYAAETISTPDIPSGATTGETGESINFATSGAASSDGHPVAYRFDWGDGTISTWTSVATRSYTWAAAGTYDVKVQASCISHPTIMSAWSAALTVTITAAAGETISPPNAPTGPATGYTNTNLVIYNAGGAISSDGHQLEYRFNFDDGTATGWYYNWTSLQVSYDTPGTYSITMQARCRTHTEIESTSSAPLVIEISLPPETLVYPGAPGAIVGISEGQINESYEYDVTHGSATNLGDPMEFQYDWGDGTFSDWTTSAVHTASHMWTVEGTYVVKYETRCTVHNDFSFSADSLVVTIVTELDETVSKPGPMSANVYPTVGDTRDYYAYGSTSSLGHAVEYQFDWGDGSPPSDWVADAGQVSHTWNVIGTFDMIRQARCVEHPAIVSEWSDPKTIYVLAPETMSTPDPPSGDTIGIINTAMYYDVFGAVSSHSHVSLEYRLDWGDGSAYTDWSTDTTQIYHVYTTPGDYEVKTQARCYYNPEVESEWSAATVASILEEVDINGSVRGRVNGGINISYEFRTDYAATTSEGHVVEYHFDFGDGTISDWSLSLSAEHAFTAVGTYDVTYQARCADHPAAVSNWAYRLRIEITDAAETLTAGGIWLLQPSTIHVGTDVTFNFRGAENNHGDSIEYQVDFGDGNVSDWSASAWNTGGRYWYGQAHHTYTAIGSYNAICRARCVAHPSVVSPWSTVKVVEVLETIASLPIPTGPMTGLVGENLTYTTVGTTSDAGHELEYRFVYTRYTSVIHESDWSTSLTDDHVFTTPHTQYRVRVNARCIAHPGAIAYSAQTDYIVITAP